MLLNKQRKYYKVLNREFNKLNKKNRSTKVFNKALPGVVFHYPTYDEVIEKQVTFMRYRITIYVSIVLCILSSCGMKPTADPTDQQANDTPVELTNISTREDVDQQVANQAKEILKETDDLTAVKAVNTSDKLVVEIGRASCRERVWMWVLAD